jgi:hypothetical protein
MCTLSTTPRHRATSELRSAARAVRNVELGQLVAFISLLTPCKPRMSYQSCIFLPWRALAISGCCR